MTTRPSTAIEKFGTSITEFEVDDGGTLSMADFVAAETRAEFYEEIASYWSCSPKDLAAAMEECEPLAWAVQSIYRDYRDELEAELRSADVADSEGARKHAALKKRLEALPEEPEDGAADWLVSLTSKQFDDRVVPRIEKWFSDPPEWLFEDDYLPETGTAQGAALAFFRDGVTTEDRRRLGVRIIEGQFPGSSYYAAELRGDIDAANRAAVEAGIPVRFKAANS